MRPASRSSATLLGALGWGGTVYELQPGERICPYHWHVGEEEWLLVLSRHADAARARRRAGAAAVGRCRLPRAARPARTRCGTTRDAVLQVADALDALDPEICVYPDSGKVGAFWLDRRRHA